MEAYCVKCKTKREMENPQPVFTVKATPATKGVCPVCGTNLFRMGQTEAHAGLTRPEPQPAAAGPRKAGRKRKGAANGRRKGRLVIVESPAKAKTVGRILG
jgi:DNA topoisomerase-1